MALHPRVVVASFVFLAGTALSACTRGGATGDGVVIERTGLVTIKGEPITLEGKGVKVGEPAPDFAAIANDLTQQKLSEYRGVTVILSCVPSLTTAVCDRETRTFNEKAIALADNCVVLTVSTDPPEVQKEWCGAHGVTRVITLSDAKLGQCGTSFGVLMKGKGRLARAVFVIDAKGIIRYEELVKEVSTEPNYAAALAAAQNAAIGH